MLSKEEVLLDNSAATVLEAALGPKLESQDSRYPEGSKCLGRAIRY
jgi:hypothetical protein